MNKMGNGKVYNALPFACMETQKSAPKKCENIEKVRRKNVIIIEKCAEKM